MKNRLVILSMLMMLSLASFARVNVAVKDTSGNSNSGAAVAVEQKKARLVEIHLRIDEIRNMDKSNLNKTERKELRTELKALRKENRAIESSLSGSNIVYLVFIVIVLGALAYELAKS